MKNLAFLRNQGTPVTPKNVLALLFNIELAEDRTVQTRRMEKEIGNLFVIASAIASKTPLQQDCVVLTVVLKNKNNSNGTQSDPHYHDSYVVTDLNDVLNLRNYLSKCKINEVATTVPKIAVGLEYIPESIDLRKSGVSIDDLSRDKTVMSDETKAEFDHFTRNQKNTL